MSASSKSGARPVSRARLAAVLLFAVAMGWLEAVVVVYIRGLLGIAHTETIPPAAEVMARFQALPWLLPTEQTREVATIVMLATVAWLGAGRLRSRLGAFLVVFGVWDIAYYAALYALLRWPPSLGTMDLLFLIPPHPWWYQPVGVPISLSLVMIVFGLWLYAAPLQASGDGRATGHLGRRRSDHGAGAGQDRIRPAGADPGRAARGLRG